MKVSEVREKYLKFFEKKGHVVIPPAPLVLENDPTTLFTSSGMQPLVPYLLGEPHPEGTRLADSQPAIRLQDIEEVGDDRHTTYFEMLGNWSLGDYFKAEQLPWIWEFLTQELNLPREKLYVTIFEGNKEVPRDEESYKIWKSLGLADDHIFEYDVKKNWWSRSGPPSEMPVGEPGGPTSEVFFEFTQVEHDSKFGEKCHPNCDCGRFFEIGNSVFMVYRKTKDGLEELSNKNVDFGGGLERLVAASNNQSDIFEIDILKPFIQKIEVVSGKDYKKNKKSMQIIADHIRAAEALIDDGVTPSNKLQGYILRRLIRRAVVKMKSLKDNVTGSDFEKIFNNKIISEEVDKFNKTLDKGMKLLGKVTPFDLFQTYGFPLELTLELAKERGLEVNVEEFKKAFEEHQNKSRSQSAGVFKGGLADHSEEVTRLHTATHLLHQALRGVLGDHISQKGSNITSERLRFDFTHPEKLTEEQLKEVEEIINEQISKKLPVSFEVMSLSDAKEKGALANFTERYGKKVKVYSIGDFSKEVCGGPHVTSLSEINGRVTITKEESLGANVRRIYAVIRG